MYDKIKKKKKKPKMSKKKKGFVEAHNKKLRSNYIIRHMDSWRINWDFIVIIFVVYNSI